MMKRTLSVLMITVLLFSVLTVSIAADTSTINANTMAVTLNKLNILQGSNGDYLLNSKIERSQAAALVIRMLGKENFVKQNAEQLKYTKFADVSSKEWYAPYVGYCTQYNIMGGYPDGRFAPKEYVSEKSFLKMALCALGYVYNTDFDWSNVYQKAYTAGIVTGQEYASRTQDNNEYLRSGAVQAIFNSLNAAKKGTTNKMVYTLVDEGLFTREFINASGILGQVKPIVIDLVTAIGYNSIEVNLNQNIQSVNVADISIVETASAASSSPAGLTVQSAAVSNDKIQVITSGQSPNKSYTVRIGNLADMAGNVTSQLTGTFTGFARQPASSDFFKISKIDQSALNVINVYFTQPVNTNSETPAYYEILRNGTTYITGSSQNITVKKLPASSNAVSILLKTTNLTPGEVYSVRISGKLSSSYGVKLGDGAGESMEFVTTSVAAGQLDVSSIVAWSSTSVRVIFTSDVDSNWAEKFINYTVYDANKTAIAVTKAARTGTADAGGRTIMLNLAAPLDKTKQYELRIEYIPDIYKQSMIEGKSYKFSGAYPENTDLAISQIISEYSNCVILNFSRPLNATAATNPSNYTMSGLTDGTFSSTPTKVLYDDTHGKNTVKLYLPSGKSFNSSQRYVVYITGLVDAEGISQSSLLRAEFTGSSYSSVEPQLADAVTVSKDAVKLTFTLEIAFDLNNINTSNYVLEYVENGEILKMEPIGVTYVDARTLVLRFDSLDPTKAYTVRFKSINDYSGVYTRTATEGGNSVTVRWGK